MQFNNKKTMKNKIRVINMKVNKSVREEENNELLFSLLGLVSLIWLILVLLNF